MHVILVIYDRLVRETLQLFLRCFKAFIIKWE